MTYLSRFRPYASMMLLFFVALIAASCAGVAPARPALTATPAPAAANGGGSVQDQLEQLAAGSQAQGATTATVQPGAGGEAASLVTDAQTPTQEPPSATATRTRRPTATRSAAVQATQRPTTAMQPSRTPRPTRTATAAPRDGLATIALDKLPPEARTTIRLIQQGGPFPYRQDGVTFGNREGRLPKRPNGYYREYTVITPGSPDRGARRIISGEAGELYYTDDHYDTFKRVILP